MKVESYYLQREFYRNNDEDYKDDQQHKSKCMCVDMDFNHVIIYFYLQTWAQICNISYVNREEKVVEAQPGLEENVANK